MRIQINNTKFYKHIRRNLGYISRKRNNNKERFQVYNEQGAVIHKQDFKKLRQELRQYDFYYRIVVSPDPKNKITKEELHKLTQETINYVKKYAKARDIVACYYTHDDTRVLHSHVII